MENNRLTVFVLLAFALLFPGYGIYFVTAALAIEILKRYLFSRKMERSDRNAHELLFRLVSYKSLTEQDVASEMECFPCFQRFSQAFRKTARLELPDFGWRSKVAATAIKSALEAGNAKILPEALKLVSSRESSINEVSSLLAAQKYTLIFSLGVASAILGITASMSGANYLYHVFAQSLISATWLKFLGNNFYESFSLTLPISLAGYLMAFSFL